MSFENAMMKRLAECGAEACREVERGLEAGRSLGDAVLDAIEVLPPKETRELRRWLEDWEAFAEWLKFEGKGWSVARQGTRVELDGGPPLHRALQNNDLGAVLRMSKPSDEAIAAAANVQGVTLVGLAGPHRQRRFLYKVVK